MIELIYEETEKRLSIKHDEREWEKPDLIQHIHANGHPNEYGASFVVPFSVYDEARGLAGEIEKELKNRYKRIKQLNF